MVFYRTGYRRLTKKDGTDPAFFVSEKNRVRPVFFGRYEL